MNANHLPPKKHPTADIRTSEQEQHVNSPTNKLGILRRKGPKIYRQQQHGKTIYRVDH